MVVGWDDPCRLGGEGDKGTAILLGGLIQKKAAPENVFRFWGIVLFFEPLLDFFAFIRVIWG